MQLIIYVDSSQLNSMSSKSPFLCGMKNRHNHWHKFNLKLNKKKIIISKELKSRIEEKNIFLQQIG